MSSSLPRSVLPLITKSVGKAEEYSPYSSVFFKPLRDFLLAAYAAIKFMWAVHKATSTFSYVYNLPPRTWASIS